VCSENLLAGSFTNSLMTESMMYCLLSGNPFSLGKFVEKVNFESSFYILSVHIYSHSSIDRPFSTTRRRRVYLRKVYHNVIN
jgi:hypothetical protein